MKTVVIIPAFNESNEIGDVLRRVRKEGYENIVVIDDGSTDDTAYEAQFADAKVVRHLINRGAGAAIQTGLKIALIEDADIIVTIDADGQHDPSEISDIIRPIEQRKTDVVIGARLIKRNSIPRVTRFFHFIANIVTFFVSGHWTRDSQSGFRAFSRRSVEMMNLRSSGFEYCSEMSREMSRNKLRCLEVPITAYYFTDARQNKGQNFSTGLETVFKLVVRSLMR